MQAKFVVFAAAIEGRTQEMSHWYDNQHFPDLLRVPGLVKAESYDLQLVKAPDGAGPWDRLSIYSFDTPDLQTSLKEMGRRMGTEEMPTSPALDSSKTLAYLALPRRDQA